MERGISNRFLGIHRRYSWDVMAMYGNGMGMGIVQTHSFTRCAKCAIFRGLSNAMLTRDAPPSRRLADAEDTAARLQDG